MACYALDCIILRLWTYDLTVLYKSVIIIIIIYLVLVPFAFFPLSMVSGYSWLFFEPFDPVWWKRTHSSAWTPFLLPWRTVLCHMVCRTQCSTQLKFIETTDWLCLCHECHGHGLQKSLLWSQIFSYACIPASRYGFDSECKAFCADLNLSEFKEIRFIGLVRCMIFRVATHLESLENREKLEFKSGQETVREKGKVRESVFLRKVNYSEYWSWHKMCKNGIIYCKVVHHMKSERRKNAYSASCVWKHFRLAKIGKQAVVGCCKSCKKFWTCKECSGKVGEFDDDWRVTTMDFECTHCHLMYSNIFVHLCGCYLTLCLTFCGMAH